MRMLAAIIGGLVVAAYVGVYVIGAVVEAARFVRDWQPRRRISPLEIEELGLVGDEKHLTALMDEHRAAGGAPHPILTRDLDETRRQLQRVRAARAARPDPPPRQVSRVTKLAIVVGIALLVSLFAVWVITHE